MKNLFRIHSPEKEVPKDVVMEPQWIGKQPAMDKPHILAHTRVCDTRGVAPVAPVAEWLRALIFHYRA